MKTLFEWFYTRHKANGVIQKLHDEYLKDQPVCSDEKPFNEIDIYTVALLFALLAIGVVMAIMALALENYFDF